MLSSVPLFAAFGIGGTELLAILAIALLFFGIEKMGGSGPPAPPRSNGTDRLRQPSRRLPFLMPTLFP
jgi:hypothetical protein